ncbi:MAG: hypothetical protein NAG76_06505 [Candidatus Pristimantibacillus lignocellulolyticus]|uniref:Uncharacterized protein n=1 Tax=Candidatus Pristimantibacillus lignocellulolyticus TaxID=2994561 RepID=A0A9J6ZIL8_9BACL|nr:MAG: hypothetical protein NAG76_06505 [Candidatus Pristimantibacillus lignocellulolyticus]
MRIWTAQRNSTLKQIIQHGMYYPDFQFANGMASEGMKAIYPDLLNMYSTVNNLKCKGLIFAISSLNNKLVTNYNDYRDFFESNPMFSDSVSFLGEDYSILELEVDKNLNLVPINFQDFIVIAMRKTGGEWKDYCNTEFVDLSYTSFENDYKLSGSRGFIIEEIDNRIEQCHMHYINIDDIVNVFPVTDYENSKTYNLSQEAITLLNSIKK